MRDINRIDEITDMLRVFWLDNPDLRFFQIVEIIKSKTEMDDAFYVEDDKVKDILMEELLNYERLGN